MFVVFLTLDVFMWFQPLPLSAPDSDRIGVLASETPAAAIGDEIRVVEGPAVESYADRILRTKPTLDELLKHLDSGEEQDRKFAVYSLSRLQPLPESAVAGVVQAAFDPKNTRSNDQVFTYFTQVMRQHGRGGTEGKSRSDGHAVRGLAPLDPGHPAET